MCGIAGFSDYGGQGLLEEKHLWMALARRMTARIAHRGPDDRGTAVSDHCALGHARLAIQDPAGGAQPMGLRTAGGPVTIAYNGELYNAPQLRRELESLGHRFDTGCDTEVLLHAYVQWGTDCPARLNGIFAFAVDDTPRQRTFLCRDRFGVKPLFYTLQGERLVFASEIKALLEYPGVHPVLDKDGLCEIFGLGPARTPGCGVFRGIRELLPGNWAVFDRDGFRQREYFALRALPHEEDYPATVARVRELLTDTVKGQLASDVPLCTFLSGGLDSCVVTAIAAGILRQKGERLATYSFEFEGNEENFVPSSFQPDRDEHWARLASDALGTEHRTLYCDSAALERSLREAVIAKDLPGMTDIDGSLLHYCRQVRKRHTVALCGECADEIFGGYPWFHRRELYDGSAFPWSNNLPQRKSLLKPEIAQAADLEGYVAARLAESRAAVPVLPGESDEQRRMREINWLNIRWFMAALLDRKDRCSMASGLEVRVPYADHRLAEYVFNVPWEMKCPDGRVKGLLRDAAMGLLPEQLRQRKKSPYPKTYDPAYEQALKRRLSLVLSDTGQPIRKLLAQDTVNALLSERYDYGRPWFGQLMAGPQMLAYLLQINEWMLHYRVRVEL